MVRSKAHPVASDEPAGYNGDAASRPVVVFTH
jgi:hypothetical protein